MDENFLELLTRADSDEKLYRLIDLYRFSCDSVEWLKNRAIQDCRKNPILGEQYARLAHRLGNCLPYPAPALGNWALGSVLLFLDQYDLAIKHYRNAYEEYLSNNDLVQVARMSVGYIGALSSAGQINEAIRLGHQIEPTLGQLAKNDPQDYLIWGKVHNNLGLVYEQIGQYDDALGAYAIKLEVARTLQKDVDIATVQHNRACLFMRLNLFREANDAFDAAEAVFLAEEAVVDLARLYLNWGLLHTQWQRYETARELLEKARDIIQQAADFSLNVAYLALHQSYNAFEGKSPIPPSMIAALHEARIIFRREKSTFDVGLTTLLLGRCYLATNRHDLAVEYLSDALAKAIQEGDIDTQWQAHYLLAKTTPLHYSLENVDLAYRRATETIETIRHGLQVEEFRATFFADKLQVYQDWSMLHIGQNNFTEAVLILERARSRILAERVENRLSVDVQKLTESADVRVSQLAKTIQTTLQTIHLLTQQVAQGNSPHGVLQEKEQLLTEQLRSLERLSPRFSPVSTGYIAPLSDVCRHLEDGTVLLYYGQIKNRLHCFVVDNNGIRSHHDLVEMTQVELACQQFYATIQRAIGLIQRLGTTSVQSYLPMLLADVTKQLDRLDQWLIAPLSLPLDAIDHLIISPDGLLCQLPFHAFQRNQRYMIEDCMVSYIPSATLLDLSQQSLTTTNAPTFFAVGYGGKNLRAITEEVKILRDRFPSLAYLIDQEATTESVLAQLPHHHLLHLATHAIFRQDRVMLSGFELADRYLTLAEISQLQFQAELVTLSGCETGFGRFHGSDLISLATGFMAAGAKSLLVSLWRVEDQVTAQLMDHFYRALQSGHSRAKSIQLAQLELLRIGREQHSAHALYQHPAYWAAFLLIGNWQPFPTGVQEDEVNFL